MIHGFDTGFLVASEVVEHSDHDGVWRRIRELKVQGDSFALTAAVLAEFIHIVTDPRRFKLPLTIAQALTEAGGWMDASDVEHVSPDDRAVNGSSKRWRCVDSAANVCSIRWWRPHIGKPG